MTRGGNRFFRHPVLDEKPGELPGNLRDGRVGRERGPHFGDPGVQVPFLGALQPLDVVCHRIPRSTGGSGDEKSQAEKRA